MLKKDITFRDFDGNTVTETHYFNMTKTEIIELELGFDNGLEAGIKKIMDSKDNLELFRIFKRIVINSYGRRVENSFIKDEEAGKMFAGSLAFDELMVGFFTNSENAADFIRGILPPDLLQQVPEPSGTPPMAPPSLPPTS